MTLENLCRIRLKSCLNLKQGMFYVQIPMCMMILLSQLKNYWKKVTL